MTFAREASGTATLLHPITYPGDLEPGTIWCGEEPLCASRDLDDTCPFGHEIALVFPVRHGNLAAASLLQPNPRLEPQRFGSIIDPPLHCKCIHFLLSPRS